MGNPALAARRTDIDTPIHIKGIVHNTEATRSGSEGWLEKTRVRTDIRGLRNSRGVKTLPVKWKIRRASTRYFRIIKATPVIAYAGRLTV
jgi:hypothetical protein